MAKQADKQTEKTEKKISKQEQISQLVMIDLKKNGPGTCMVITDRVFDGQKKNLPKWYKEQDRKPRAQYVYLALQAGVKDGTIKLTEEDKRNGWVAKTKLYSVA